MLTVSTSDMRLRFGHAQVVVELVALWALAIGASLLFASLANAWMLGVAAGVSSCVALAVLFLTRENAQTNRIALLVCAVLFALTVVVGTALVQGAVLTLFNGVIDAWNIQFDTYVPHYSAGEPGMVEFALLGLALGLVEGLLLHVLSRVRSRVLVGVVVGVIILVDLLSLHPNLIAMMALLAGWAGLSASYAPVRLKRGTASAAVMVVVLACVGIGAVVFGNYDGSTFLTQGKQAFLASIDGIRYGSDSLPQGDLSKAASMVEPQQGSGATPEEEASDRLELTFDSAANVHQMYLRGYTGAVYDGNAWEPLARSNYEGDWDGLFTWLSEHRFDALLQSAQYQTADAQVTGTTLPTSSLSVQNVGAYRKYAYVPYGTAATAGGASDVLDRYLLGEGLTGGESYEVTSVPEADRTELLQPAEWLYDTEAEADGAEGEFVLAEGVYRSFVRENYEEVSATDAALIDELFYGEDWSDEDANNLYSLVTRVRTVLDATCSVEEQPARLPANTSFLRWFLTDAHEGNSAYFATAAVLAFRQADLPARYAEGYLLQDDAAQAMTARSQDSAVLTGHEAHAWVEVYVDGYGWMPVEVTPGFYDPVYSSGETIEVPKEVAGNGSDDQVGSLGNQGSEEDEQQADSERHNVTPLGVVALVMATLMLLVVLAELQRLVRVLLRRHRCTQARQGADDDFVRWLYAYVSGLLSDAGRKVSPLKPFGTLEGFDRAFPGMRVQEAQRMLEMLQSSVFGGYTLSVADVRALLFFATKLERSNMEQGSFGRDIFLRYVKAYASPFGLAIDKFE